MKCPNCGKWNRASLPHCVYCGEAFETDHFYNGLPEPAWRASLGDKGDANAFTHVDDNGDVEATVDPRDALAMEMVDLKTRKVQGEVQQRRLRQSAAERGMAPSGRSVRTTSNRGTFFSAIDNPESTLRPVDPELIEDGNVDANARIVYTEKYRHKNAGRSGSAYDEDYSQRRVNPNGLLEEQVVYDGYYDTSLYIPPHSRQDEYEHSLRMRPTSNWKPRRTGMRRMLRMVLMIMVLVAVIGGGYLFVYPRLAEQPITEEAEATITPTIRDDLAAHTITIPGEDGQRITIRELRTSAIVTGGVATFDILDHIWYDDFADYLQDTMTVTLTPYLMTETGKQQPLKQIDYDIDIPLSPIDLNTPDAPYKVVSTAMYNIVFYVREGSAVSINGQDYSDLVDEDDGAVSFNATVQPIGENNYHIRVRSQYCRENNITLTLYREKQDIPLDLASDIASRTTSKVLLVRATTLPGAVVKVLSPHSDLDITNTKADGSFSFNALFDKIGDNMISISTDFPGRETTVVNHSIYYVPNIDDYSKAAWDVARDYNDLVNNIEARKRRSQIYVCMGVIKTIDTTKPQRAMMECTSDGNTVTIYVENSSRTTWVEGESYRLYADTYGMYDSKPWLIARYTYSQGEY